MVWRWAACSIVPGFGEGMDKRFYGGLKIHVRTIDNYCMYLCEMYYTETHRDLQEENPKGLFAVFYRIAHLFKYFSLMDESSSSEYCLPLSSKITTVSASKLSAPPQKSSSSIGLVQRTSTHPFRTLLPTISRPVLKI
mgnify:CR=1 FL=1